ncbi:PREDICTED: uncharacterized protein LOC108558217 [Nicrophorus vespilloides]|uniref:Uncharacterized protein LOC108558217 n=1 Tax=Nicrophorus vespilloides TaxID=110193 RepID=A0ABM1M7J5_NICVS|nr:PREDICTED: uncharacterized protein LOC108558217 [Nicrophorus vespilloides]
MALTKLFIVVALAVAYASASPASSSSTDLSFEETIAKYIQHQEVSIDIPFVDSKVTLDARNLEEDELDLKVQLSAAGEARKSSKLKKIFAPIFLFVMLKAVTLIPMALGLLSLKTFNALQLSFVTFVISIGLAVYKLCQKVPHEHAPVVSHSAPWKRSISEESAAQQMAYSAYIN